VNPAEALPDPPLSPFALKGLVEKPRVEEAPSAFVVAARFVLHPAIFDALRATPADSRDELNLPDAMRRLHERGMPLWAAPLLPGEARRDIGNFETFFANFLRFALRDPEYGEALRHTLADETNRAP
jgi:UTP--glucose-1-phosphate uridylyltransferase